VEAAQQAGFTLNPDLNGARQDGVGYSQMTRLGRFRGSTARTYLARAKGRANLQIKTDALATRLVLDGKRCIGVAFTQAGTACEATARREVIVAGGAVNSPHLLQISGIGPAAHLRSIGLEVAHDLPGVGANLADHYAVRVVHRAHGQTTMNELSRGWRKAREIGRFFLEGRGALTFGVTSAQVFCHSREGLASPDIQLLFTPASYEASKVLALEYQPGWTTAICPTRPASRGTIMATSADPAAAPAIRPRYLSDSDDLRVLKAGIGHARRINAAPALARYSVAETRPGPAVDDDAGFNVFATEQGNTLYHPVGTCGMGTHDMAVVDAELRVHGLAGLRVVDASVMPTLPTGNTNAPTIMIAEKAAAMIQAAARA
jgi:choline dehydrogenase